MTMKLQHLQHSFVQAGQMMRQASKHPMLLRPAIDRNNGLLNDKFLNGLRAVFYYGVF